MIACVPRRRATVLGVMACVAGVGLVWAANVEALTGTPAALRLLRRLEAQTARFPAVRNVPTGYVVYCPQIPPGWINVPLEGCREHAHVTEEIDLSHGRTIRYVTTVTARSQPTIRSVASARGWFQRDQGLDCWLQFPLPFFKQLLVGFPLSGEQVRIVAWTSTVAVIGAVASRFGYRELDSINPLTDLIYRVDEFNSVGRKTYRETDHLNYLFRQPPAPSTTPVCA
jgi:hypothetical protein